MTFRFEPLAYLRLHGLDDMTMECRSFLEPENRDEPDWDRFQEMEDSYGMRCISMREDGKLVGYAGLEMADDIRHKGKILSIIRDIYITKEKRGHAPGFMKFIEDWSSKLGANRVTIAEKYNTGTGEFYSHLGFKPEEIWWAKEL